MKNQKPGLALEELAAKLGAEFQGQADLKLTSSCGLDSPKKEDSRMSPDQEELAMFRFQQNWTAA